MDPLSISASILAILTAVTTVGTALEKLWSLRDVPVALLALMNEVTDVQVVLSAMRDSINTISSLDSTPTQTSLRRIQALVDRTAETVEELESLIQRLSPRLDKKGRPRIPPLFWLKESKILDRIHQNLRDSRQNLATTLIAISNVQQQAVLGTVVLAVQEVSALLRDGVDGTLTGAGDVERILSVPPPRPTSPNRENAGHSGSEPETASSTQVKAGCSIPITESQEILRFSTSMSGQNCQPLCRCQCHLKSRISTPRWLRGIFGMLFYGYSGSPVPGIWGCDYGRYCNSGSHNRFDYYFPSWLLNRALSITISWHAVSGLGASWTIRIPKIVDLGVPFQVLSQWNHPEYGSSLLRLQHYMHSRSITPFDVNQHGISLLHTAARSRNPGAYVWLLQSGADPFLEDEFGRTPVSIMLDNFLQLEAQKRPELSRTVGFEHSRDILRNMQFTCLHKIVLGLFDGDISHQLSLDDSMVDLRDALGRTPLCWAAIHDNRDAMRQLLDRSANSELADCLGLTPLHWAVLGKADFTRSLLNAGASVHAKAFGGFEPLHFATGPSKSNRTIIQLLLAFGASLEALSDCGYTPLHLAVFRACVTSIQALLDSGADIDARGPFGATSVIIAASYNEPQCMKLLLDRGARLDIPDNNGAYAHHYATMYGGTEIMGIITDHGVHGVNPEIEDYKGWTIWDYFKARDSIFIASQERDRQQEEVVLRALLSSFKPLATGDANGPNTRVVESNELGMNCVGSRIEGVISAETTDDLDVFFDAEETSCHT